MKNYTTLLIDADETLLDFAAAEEFSIRRVCESFGIPYSAEVGRTYSEINLALWKKLEKGEVTREVIKLRRFEEFAAVTGCSAAPEDMAGLYVETLTGCGFTLKGADAACRALKEKYRLFIVTNGIASVQKGRLTLSGLLPYFSGYFISEESGFSKPDKRFFDFVLDSVGVEDKSEVCIIGDSLTSDIQGGVNSGIDTCLFGAVKGDYTPCPTYVAKDFDELLKLF